MNKLKLLKGAFEYFFIKNKIIGFILVLPIILIISLIIYLYENFFNFNLIGFRRYFLFF